MNDKTKCSNHNILFPKDSECLICTVENIERQNCSNGLNKKAISNQRILLSDIKEVCINYINKYQLEVFEKDKQIDELSKDNDFFSNNYFDKNEENRKLKNELERMEMNISDNFLVFKKLTQREASLKVSTNIKQVIRTVFDSYPIENKYTSHHYLDFFEEEIKKERKKANIFYGTIMRVLQGLIKKTLKEIIIKITDKNKLKEVQNKHALQIEEKLKNQLTEAIDRIEQESLDILERKESQKEELRLKNGIMKKNAIEGALKISTLLIIAGFLSCITGFVINGYIMLNNILAIEKYTQYILQVFPFVLFLLLVRAGLNARWKGVGLLNLNDSNDVVFEEANLINKLKEIKNEILEAGKVIKNINE